MIDECDKRTMSLKEAQNALNYIKKNRGKKSFKKRNECRYYYCKQCHGWHLTSNHKK